MNRKQENMWHDLRSLLMNELTENDALTVYDKAVTRWREFTKFMDNETESRKSKAVDSILPRVAVYAVLLEGGHPVDRIMTTYNEKYAGAAMHNKYAKMERIPGFFGIFRRIFMSFTNKSEFWECRSKKTSDGFRLDINKCLWKDCCDIAGYPEACTYFCDCDDITYGGLRKVGFKRTQTLGKGGDKCDFEFYKKHKNINKRS